MPESKNNSVARRGAPYGNRNAWKTGAHAAEVRAWRRRVADWRKRVRAALAEAEPAVIAAATYPPPPA